MQAGEARPVQGLQVQCLELVLERLGDRAPEALSGHDLALAAGLNEDAAFARPLAESWEHACSWLVRRAIELARSGSAQALCARGLGLSRAGRAVALPGESAPSPPLVRAAGLLLAQLWTAGRVSRAELERLDPRPGALRAHNHALTEAGERVCLRALSARPQSCLAELGRDLDCLRAGLRPTQPSTAGPRLAAAALGIAVLGVGLGWALFSDEPESGEARGGASASPMELQAELEEARARWSESWELALQADERDERRARLDEQLQRERARADRARSALSSTLVALAQSRWSARSSALVASELTRDLEAIAIASDARASAQAQPAGPASLGSVQEAGAPAPALAELELALERLDAASARALAGEKREAAELLSTLAAEESVPNLVRGRAQLELARVRFELAAAEEARAALLAGAECLTDEPGEEVSVLSAYLKLVSHHYHRGDEQRARDLAARGLELADRRPDDCALVDRLRSYARAPEQGRD